MYTHNIWFKNLFESSIRDTFKLFRGVEQLCFFFFFKVIFTLIRLAQQRLQRPGLHTQ